MNVGKKISLACAVLVLLTVIMAGVALYRVGDIHSKLQSITGQSLPGVYSVGKLAQINRTITGNMLLHLGIPSVHQEMETKIINGEKQFSSVFEEYGKSIETPDEKQLYDAIPPIYNRLRNAWDRIRPLSNAGRTEAAWQLWMTDGRPALLELEQKLNAEIDFARNNGARNAQATSNSVTSAQSWITVLLVLSILSGGGLAFVIVRGLNLMLRRAALDLSTSAAQVASAAKQVASASQSLAQGATEQAASLEATFASTEQITATTRRNAEHSSLAAEATRAVDRQVEEGNRTLSEMLVSMAEINASSGKVSKIIRTIDQIAFQTNILALNAAVEAARAGEAGLGFSVVAEEVRTLAQRSAQAAKETAALIEESVAKSNLGTSRLELVVGVIRTISDGSARVKALVEELHHGSEDQAHGIEQIAKAIAQMNQVTQTTAASAEESAAASQQLSGHAAGMGDLVSMLQAVVGSRESEAPVSGHAAARSQLAVLDY